MDFSIILPEGTDSIKFGMTHEEIRNVLGKEPELFRKNEFDKYMTEDYKDTCHVYYDGSVCAAFEFFSPSQVFYNNTPLLCRELKALEELFPDFWNYKESDGLYTFARDFSVWGRFGFTESVYISRKGYFAEQYNYYQKKYSEKYGV